MLNFLVGQNLNYREVTHLRQIPLFGESISVAEGVSNPWMLVGQLSLLLFVLFVSDAAITVWRRGDRRLALVTGGSIVSFAVAGLVLAVLVLWGIVHWPLVASWFFMAIVVSMAYEMINEMLRAAQLSDELQQKRNELSHIARVSTMGQLASTLAHELNQPLGAILRNAEAAKLFLDESSPDLDEVRAILSDICKDDQRAGEVIDRMRSLLKRGKVENDLLDLNLSAGEVISLVRPEADTRNVRLVFEPSPSASLVRGDRVHLQQVMLNLLINAMEAMDDSAPDGRVITVRLQAGGTQVEVVVSDNGQGIPTDKLDQVFEPFYSSKTNGLGMGLAISRGIIEAHGGRLRAQNNEAGGTTFTITLPTALEGAK
jgi:signal transduction histidine kinase